MLWKLANICIIHKGYDNPLITTGRYDFSEKIISFGEFIQTDNGE
jgi:hypothetical protein